MLDIRGDELLVIILLAIILIGPERLPEYVTTLKSAVKRGKALLDESKNTIKSEFGDDIDWRQYDPRQYDPRRIVREALSEPVEESPRRAARTGGTPPGGLTVAEQLARRAPADNPASQIGAAYASEALAGGVAASVAAAGSGLSSASPVTGAVPAAAPTAPTSAGVVADPDATPPLGAHIPELPIAFDPEST